MLNAFGLQQSGLFRRAIELTLDFAISAGDGLSDAVGLVATKVLPLLLLACSTEHSKVRAASGDCLLQLLVRTSMVLVENPCN